MNRIKSLDVLKAILIWLVVFTHSRTAESMNCKPLFCFFVDMAVPAFLIISGYVNAKHTDIIYKDYFKTIPRKILSIIIPFSVCILFDLFCWTFIESFDIKEILRLAILGRWGDGGFYPYILIQFILFYPFLIKASKSKIGISLVVIINLLFEIITYFGIVPESLYRILIFRYLILIMIGILLRRCKSISYLFAFVLMLIGLFCVYATNYLIPEHGLFPYWRSTSFLISLWPAAWVALALIFKDKFKGKLIDIISTFGKSTYYVLLFQMIYYYAFRVQLLDNEPHWILSIVFCSIGGFVWYCIDQKYVIRKILYPNKH